MKKKLWNLGLWLVILINFASILFSIPALLINMFLPSMGAYEAFLLLFVGSLIGEVLLIGFMKRRGILLNSKIKKRFEECYATTIVAFVLALFAPLLDHSLAIMLYQATVFFFVQSAIWWSFAKED